MFRSQLRKWVMGAAVAVTAWTSAAPEANAFWHRWGSWGSSGGSSGGSWGSSGGSYGSWGSSGGSSGGWRARRAYRHYHSSGGSYGSWGSSGGSSGYTVYYSGSSGGSSGGSYGSWGSSGGSSGGVIVEQHESQHPMTDAPADGSTPAPMDGTAPAPMDDMTPPGMTMFNPANRSAILNVEVPPQAQVYVNGLATRSTGAQRRYVSNGLKPGYNYTYELRAEVEVNGEKLTETKTINVQAGQSADVAFNFSDEHKVANKPVRTTLRLNVPDAAKVTLAGNESGSTGAVREFTTTRLSDGQSWDGYTIRVELDRNGEKLVKEQTISLAAGDTRELTIGFDDQVVANAAGPSLQ